jgi:hypothetical protein
MNTEDLNELRGMNWKRNPVRCFKRLRHLDRYLRECCSKDILVSELIMMITEFRRCTGAGYALSASKWYIGCGNEDSINSKCDYVHLSGRVRYGSIAEQSSVNMLAGIRAEGLRCLLQLLKYNPDTVFGRWTELLRDSPTSPGLVTIAGLDPDACTRRLALSCAVSLLRCDQFRKWKGPLPDPMEVNFPHASLALDISKAIGDILGLIRKIISKESQEDVENVLFQLKDVLKHTPWPSLKNGEELLQDLGVHLITLMGHNDTRILSKAFDLMAWLLKFVKLQPNQIKRVIEELNNPTHSESGEDVLNANLILNRLGASPSSLINGKIIHIGLDIAHSYLHDAYYPEALVPHICSCMLNLPHLKELTPEIQKRLLSLNGSVVKCNSDISDAFFLGIGKLSRRSKEASDFVACIKLDLIHPSPKLIQSVGDQGFSCMLFNGNGGVKVELLCKWLGHPVHRHASLRAIMTGLSRMNESGVHCDETLQLHLSKSLSSIWASRSATSAQDDRLFPDTLRSVGLLLKGRDDSLLLQEFKSEAKNALTEALRSERTQVLLAAIYSIEHAYIREGKLEIEFSESLADVVDTQLKNLLNRQSWDYSSAPAIAATFHILRDALTVLKYGSIRDRDWYGRFRSVILDGRVDWVFKYNEKIQEYVCEINNKLTSSVLYR